VGAEGGVLSYDRRVWRAREASLMGEDHLRAKSRSQRSTVLNREGESLAGSCVETPCVCPPKQGIAETG
jgi:hypothetical protein